MLKKLKIPFNERNIELTVSPYFLERTCSKNICEINDDMQKIIVLQKNIDDMQKRLNNGLTITDKYIFEEIGKLPANKIKNAIKFKRNLSDKKFNKLKFEYIPNLSNKCKVKIEECRKLHENILKTEEEKKQIFEINKEKSIKFLREELKKNKSFSNALSLSIKEELEKNILNFKNDEDVTLNKKMNDTIYSLRNYYNRMTNKPSPFSTFVSTSICLNSSKLNEVAFAKNSGYTPKVYINELVPKTLENLFLEDSRFIQHFFIKINPLLQISSDGYEFLNVDVSNSKMYYSENVLKIKRDDKIDSIVNNLKIKGNTNLLTFSECLMESNPDKFSDINEIVVLILKLDKLGILYKNFNINHQDYSVMYKLHKLSKIFCDDKYKKISNSLGIIISNLEKINGTFDLTTEEKRQIREIIFFEVKVIFSMYPENRYDLDFIRKNILYENNTYPNIKYRDFASEQIVENFYYIEKLYRIFDNNYISRILCRNTFLENYDSTSKVSILEFYKKVSTSKEQKINNVLANDEDIKIISSIRKEFLKYLHKNINKSEIDIPIKFIQELYSKTPKIMKDKISYGMYYQTDGITTVVNHSAPGIGRHIIRYINDLNKNDQKIFLQKYEKHLKKFEKNNIVFTDIGSTLGLGINKHIEVLRAAFSYPKSNYDNEISFNNLKIIFDSNVEAIKISDEKGIIYESTPMGFLFPRVSPGFYGFLATLSNTQGGGTSFWDRYYTWYESENRNSSIMHFPRITVGNKFVISRETWKIKPNSIKFDPAKSDADNYINFCDYLCNQNGIPIKFFAKMSRDLDGILEFGQSIDEWEKVISNNKLRKPQFYDLNNYLDYHNLCSLIKNYSYTTLTIQENLPNYFNPKEYLLELNEVKGSEQK